MEVVEAAKVMVGEVREESVAVAMVAVAAVRATALEVIVV